MAAPAIAALATRALPALQTAAEKAMPHLLQGAGSELMSRGLNAFGGKEQEPVNYATNQDAQQKPAVY
jgi:hypothetical protein